LHSSVAVFNQIRAIFNQKSCTIGYFSPQQEAAPAKRRAGRRRKGAAGREQPAAAPAAAPQPQLPPRFGVLSLQAVGKGAPSRQCPQRGYGNGAAAAAPVALQE